MLTELPPLSPNVVAADAMHARMSAEWFTECLARILADQADRDIKFDFDWRCDLWAHWPRWRPDAIATTTALLKDQRVIDAAAKFLTKGYDLIADLNEALEGYAQPSTVPPEQQIKGSEADPTKNGIWISSW